MSRETGTVSVPHAVCGIDHMSRDGDSIYKMCGIGHMSRDWDSICSTSCVV